MEMKSEERREEGLGRVNQALLFSGKRGACSVAALCEARRGEAKLSIEEVSGAFKKLLHLQMPESESRSPNEGR